MLRFCAAWQRAAAPAAARLCLGNRQVIRPTLRHAQTGINLRSSRPLTGACARALHVVQPLGGGAAFSAQIAASGGGNAAQRSVHLLCTQRRILSAL